MSCRGRLVPLLVVAGCSSSLERSADAPAPRVRAREATRKARTPPPPPRFPDAQVRLSPLRATFPERFGVRRVFIDPGHGTGTNSGMTSVHCTEEQAINLATAKALKKRLEATGHFRVRLARKDASGPTYKKRLAAARRWRAEVLLSLHADARGASVRWSPRPGAECPRSDEQPGFSILWSNDGAEPLVERRHRLARALARRMTETGLPAYDGYDYGGLYDGDDVRGVFRDRRGLYMLRRPPMPSVIIETHHAWHLQEATRWGAPATGVAFASAVVAALIDLLAPRG